MSSPSSSEGPAPVPPAAPVSGDVQTPLPPEPEGEGLPPEAVPPEATELPAEELAEDDTSAHRFECRSCGFVYDPAEGVRKLGIAAGTAFEALDPATFRCPVCRSRMGAFRDIGPREKPSGFEENLNFGLGVNRLTPGQKNVLIFGGFALAIAFFLSLYSLR
ncbi:MAG: rubredoxin [Cyanobacteriota bacterium]|jgi:rubredoxin